jgi:GT2 family glycosyltransferase
MPESPSVSVIVPVHNGGAKLGRAVGAILSCADQPSELIVVDDASTDGAADESGRDGRARLLRLARRCGPAAARNAGARGAGGDVLFFVDADVAVRPDAITRVRGAFRDDPRLAAVFGSYDDDPAERNFFSQYKNLSHHFVHQHSQAEAATFWAGCGAVRREVFRAAGGFDEEKYKEPSVEDIELGYRMTAAGHRVLLDKGLQAKHLKRWGFASLLRADIFYRAAPWSRLALEGGGLVNQLNLRTGERVCAVLTPLALLAALASPFAARSLYVALFACALVVAVNHKFYGFFLRQRGAWFAARVLPVHLLYYLYSGTTFAVCWCQHALGPRAGGGRAARRGSLR